MTIEKNSSVPIYKQLAEEIIKKINAGEFLAETKLPPIRALANELQLNNATVVGAYKYLEQKKFVFSVMGSGTFVAAKKPPETFKIHENCINFSAATTDAAFFPTENFRRAFDAIISRDGAGAFEFPGGHGFAPLREKISQLLKICDGISAAPENIFVTRDINHGINILLDELISPGDYVLVETPTSQNAHNIFVSRGAKILEVPFREKNLDAEKFIFLVKKYSPKIFYLSPTFQMPTGLCYTESSKSLALELAYNCGAHILEVNDCGDFFYGARPSPLKAADTRDRVIYLKSFDKILAPGLAGYVVCPREILSRLHADGTSGCIQRSLDFYLNDFDFDAHCAKIRGVYSRRFKRTISAAETFFSRCASFEKPEGGLGIWIRANGNFADEFLARNVLVSPGNLYSAGAQNFFRISFANTHEDDISKGIGIIASVLSTFSNGRQVGNGKRIALDNRDDSTRFD